MKTSKTFRAVVVALTCLGVFFPHSSFATEMVVNDGFQVNKDIQDLSLQDGVLIGGLVDSNGRGVEDAPVVIGQNGKAIVELRTDAEGRFAVKGLKPGVYQVVSHGGLDSYRVWEADQAPANAKKGVIQVVDPNVARGATSGSAFDLANILIAGLVIIPAVAIPLALDDDDAS